MSKHTHRHTSGPWVACDNNGYSIWRVTAESASGTVAEVVGDSAETEANARLIAAAPEMFELIQQTASAIERGCANMTPAAQLAVALLQLRNQAKELLAKIEEGGE